MTGEVYFESANTRKRYAVIGFDEARKKVRLKSEDGFEFDETYNPEMFRQMGYELKQGA